MLLLWKSDTLIQVNHDPLFLPHDVIGAGNYIGQ